MKSILIKNTTREERERIVAESIGNIDGACDGCAAGLAEMYQDYIRRSGISIWSIAGDMIRKQIVFHGWVQGVGFRYRAIQAANKNGAAGWVRNDPGGTVTMEIQGTEEQILLSREAATSE